MPDDSLISPGIQNLPENSRFFRSVDTLGILATLSRSAAAIPGPDLECLSALSKCDQALACPIVRWHVLPKISPFGPLAALTSRQLSEEPRVHCRGVIDVRRGGGAAVVAAHAQMLQKIRFFAHAQLSWSGQTRTCLQSVLVY